MPEMREVAKPVGRLRHSPRATAGSEGLLLFAGVALLAPRVAQAADWLLPPLPVTLRVQGGVAVHATESEWVTGRVSGALDLALGVPLMFDPRQSSADYLANKGFVHPELGYSYQDTGQHLFSVGGYAGFGHLFLYGSYGVRFLIGRQSEETALGLRHGMGLHALHDLLTLEVSHQPLWVGGAVQHDVIVWLGLNPLQFFNLVAVVSGGP